MIDFVQLSKKSFLKWLEDIFLKLCHKIWCIHLSQLFYNWNHDKLYNLLYLSFACGVGYKKNKDIDFNHIFILSLLENI